MPGSISNKNFWRRPEGVVGMLVLGGGIFAGFWGIYLILPVLNTILGSILSISILLILAGIIGYILFDRQTRNLAYYTFQSAMRWLTGLFIKIDPISILKSYIKELKSKMRKMSSQIGRLRGHIRQLESIQKQNIKQIDKELEVASSARDNQDERALLLASRKAARLKESNEKYENLLNRMNHLYAILTKVYKNTEIVLEDTIHQVRLKEVEYNAIKASHSAMASARAILSGDSNSRAIFDHALEQIADDVAMKMGEIDHFMQSSSNFMQQIDLQQATYAEEGLSMLEKLEAESQVLKLEKPGDYSILLEDLERKAKLEVEAEILREKEVR
jgi:hypothetical protein